MDNSECGSHDKRNISMGVGIHHLIRHSNFMPDFDHLTFCYATFRYLKGTRLKSTYKAGANRRINRVIYDQWSYVTLIKGAFSTEWRE
jgi:hypothetical protein